MNTVARAPWPCLRGTPQNSGWSPAPGPGQGRLRWSFASPDALAGPPIAAADGALYLGTGRGLLALTAAGERAWMLATGQRTSPPALDAGGNLVAAVHGEGLLFAGADGQERSRAAQRLDTPSAPALAEDGTIYVGTHQLVFAFAADGRPSWSTNCFGAIAYPPALAPDGRLHVKAQERYSWDDDEFAECQDTLATLGPDGVLESSEQARGYAVDGDCWGTNEFGGDCAALCDERGTPVAGVGRQLAIGRKKVPLQGHGPLALAPTAVLYAGTARGLAALSRDGTVRWTLDTGGPAAHPVVDSEGRVFCASKQGTIYAATREGRPLWLWELPAGDRRVLGLSIGAEETLYVATRNALYALG